MIPGFSTEMLKTDALFETIWTLGKRQITAEQKEVR
jgi:hypothetical protein